MSHPRTEFGIRYYEWALAWTHAEAKQEFTTISTVSSQIARLTLRFFEALSTGDRVALASGLVKRFHPDAVRITNTAPSPHELEMIAAKDAAVVQGASALLGNRRRLNPEHLRAAVRPRLAARAGTELDEHPSGARYRLSEGPWHLTTHVTFLSEPVYVQYIRTDANVSLAEAISILAWTGFCGQTVWDSTEGGEEAAVADAIKTACGHFIDKWPDLVRGLTP
jgi:hypothetical protein